MGMRCSQPMGLPKSAQEFLGTNVIKVNGCPHCRRYYGLKEEKIGTYGMFDELSLYRYYLVDGSFADEFVQHEIWDCGPMTWLGLKIFRVDQATNIMTSKFVWSDSAFNSN